MAEHAVVIAGGGPTGMMLAAELALAQVDVVIVERRATPDPDRARAGGLHARTIEVLDQRGVADRFLEEGKVMQIQGFGRIRLDISDFPSRHNYGLALPQIQTERLLATWVQELGVPITREREVTGFTQDGTGVDVALSDGTSIRAGYLVGCDGGRSVIRKPADIEFAGWDPSTSWLMAEVEMAAKPEFGPPPGGGTGPAQRGDRIRVVLAERQGEHASAPSLHDVSEALIAADGTDYGVHSLSWASRFTDNTRQAASYRQGRILLAGDAAHVHAPLGGQGLNIGVQDAVNLGWKLAQVIKNRSPESLLDTYHAERHPVAAAVLRNTMAQVALLRTDDRTDALREITSEILRMDQPRKRIAGMMTGLDIRYDFGDGHPLLGRRMPDLDLITANGEMRTFTLLHDGKGVLLNFSAPGHPDIAPWADRIRPVDARYAGAWELPVIGTVTAPDTVLIRPDGYVAWAGDKTGNGLTDALAKWFGAPRKHAAGLQPDETVKR